jgi:hypothetical protein
MLLAAIRDAFVLDAAVRDLVQQRIHAERAPAGTQLPYITLTAITTTHEYDLEGEIDVLETVLQVDVWAESFTVRANLAEATRKLLSGVRAKVGSSAHWALVLGSTIERDDESSEAPVDASDAWVFRSSRDYRINWQRG